MYLEIERKLYTASIAALGFSCLVILVPWSHDLLGTSGFRSISKALGSGAVAIVVERVFHQLIAALICLVPLKLTRRRLSVVDCLLVGIGVTLFDWVMLACESWR
jgi:hypothetical protein